MGFAAAALVGAAVGSVASTLVGGGLLGAILGGVLSNVVTGALAPKPKSQSYADREQGIQLNVTSTVAPIPVIYGERGGVGGMLCFMETTGTTNEYLHMVMALCEGEIEAIDAVYLDDVATTDAKFTGYVDVHKHLGSSTQTVDTNLQAEVGSGVWTNDHRLRGVAYVYLRLKYSTDKFPGGVPRITADVRGKKVINPTTGAVAYSSNPAACIYDYLINGIYGASISASDIDLASFVEAQAYCDEAISSIPRFSCNGVLLTGRQRLVCASELLSSCFGMLVFSGGLYSLKLLKSETPVMTFNEDNIIGEWSINLGNKRGRYNRVRAAWTNPDKNWQPDLYLAQDVSYQIEDNELVLEADVELPFATTFDEAVRLAWRHMRQSRFGMSVQFTATLEALNANAGDVVYITHSTPGFVNQTFRITRIRLLPEGLVQVEATQYSAAVYTDETDIAPSLPSALTLKDASTIAPPTSLALANSPIVQEDGSVLPRIEVTWVAPADVYLHQYELEWKRASESVWTSVTLNGSQTSYFIVPAMIGVSYDVRIRSVNVLGVRSSIVSNSTGVTGDITGPTAATGFIVTGVAGGISLSWTNPSDADLSYIEVWEASSNNRSLASRVAEVFSNAYVRPLASGLTRYYWLMPRDTSGNTGTWNAAVGSGEWATSFAAVSSYGALPDPKPPVDADKTATAINSGLTVVSGSFSAGITFAAAGHIKGGQSAYNSGTGWFLGYSDGYYKFSVGDPLGDYVAFNGSTLVFRGDIPVYYDAPSSAGGGMNVISAPVWTTLSVSNGVARSATKAKEIRWHAHGRVEVYVYYEVVMTAVATGVSAQLTGHLYKNGSLVHSFPAIGSPGSVTGPKTYTYDGYYNTTATVGDLLQLYLSADNQQTITNWTYRADLFDINVDNIRNEAVVTKDGGTI